MNRVRSWRRAVSSTASFWMVASAFTVTVLGTTLPTPLFLHQLLRLDSPALAGAVVCAVFAASALGQVVLVRPLGAAAITVVMLGGALAAGSLVLLLVAAGVAGLGQGVSFRTALAALNTAAPVEHRAQAASTFFVVATLATTAAIASRRQPAARAGR